MTQDTTSQRLDRSDWLRAGLVALAEGGVDTVRVEPLARRMGVTKGSFYWHFKDRQDLLVALREAWEHQATLDIIDAVEATGGDPAERAWRLMELCMAVDGRIELAMRSWAQTDPDTGDLVRRVDRARLDYTEQLFRQIGFDEPTARARARFAYFALIGEYALGVESQPEERLAAARLNYEMLRRRD